MYSILQKINILRADNRLLNLFFMIRRFQTPLKIIYSFSFFYIPFHAYAANLFVYEVVHEYQNNNPTNFLAKCVRTNVVLCS